MQTGIRLSFNAAFERFIALYASLSNAFMRMARIAWYELLISGVPKEPRKVIGIKAISKFFSFISLAVYFLGS